MARISEVAAVMEALAPRDLAESWDNVGLQIGNPSDPVGRILVTLEVTPAVVDEAERLGADLIISHHPLIFSPLKQIDTGSPIGRLIWGLICRRINLFVAHTNLDIAPGGVSDRLAEVLGVVRTEPLQQTGREALFKLVVFVPENSLAAVREALAVAGAGEIGDYAGCSFASPGTGSFCPQPRAHPAIGNVGETEFVSEQRLEVLVPERRLACVLSAMLRAHPYEEVAHDLYRLENSGSSRGIGRVGWLSEPGTLGEVGRRAAARLGSRNPKLSGDLDMWIERIALCGGSGKGLVEQAARCGAQALLAGDFGHHDALTARALGIALIDLGHHATEHPTLAPLAATLWEKLHGIEALVSQVDTEPWGKGLG